jgi:hypothetical protein
MTLRPQIPITPRIEEALDELKHVIAALYPDATFVVERGSDPTGIYLVATVDVPETDLVFELVVDRLIDMQVEEGLPVYVVVLEPKERVLAELHRRQSRSSG